MIGQRHKKERFVTDNTGIVSYSPLRLGAVPQIILSTHRLGLH